MITLFEPGKIVFTIILGLLFTACSAHTIKPRDKLTVAVSIIPQETFVKKVAGDLIDVVTVIPPGKSPANYAPTPYELEQLSCSSIYFTIGVPAEESSILPRLKEINRNINIIYMEDSVTNHYSERKPFSGKRDPHIWLSPKRAVVMIENIALELSAIDNTNSVIYHRNAQEYISELKKLDEEIESLLNKTENKTFIIYHPCLGYFADDYGFTMVSLQSDGKDAAPDDLEKIIDTAKKEKIKNVFYQAENDSRQSRVVASEIGDKAIRIDALAFDYINNLYRIASVVAGSYQ